MFIDKNQKRINIYAPFTDADGTKWANLCDPAVRQMNGVTEIAEPAPPADYTPETYYRNEIDAAPYVVYDRKSDMQIALQEQQQQNATARAYLAETDWYIIREQETGVAVPPDVLEYRAIARESILSENDMRVPAPQ